MNHSFDTRVAKRYGVTAAIFIEHIRFWVIRNRANGDNQHDGRTWTYNSVRAFAEIFPYLTPKQIRRALDDLEHEEVLISGNFNKQGRDRTKWYAFVDEEKWYKAVAPITEEEDAIRPGGQSHLPGGANTSAQEGKPLPDINSGIKPDTPPKPPKGGGSVDSEKKKSTKGDGWDRLDETSKQIFDQSFWPAYLAFHRPNDPKALARKAWATAVRKRKAAPNEILEGMRKFRLFVEDKREREGERFDIEKAVPMAATWLNQDRWTNDYGGVVEQAKANDRANLKGFELFEYDYMAWSRAGRKGEPPKIESYPGAEKGR